MTPPESPPTLVTSEPTPLRGSTVVIMVPGTNVMPSLVGPRDENISLIETAFPDVQMLVRGEEVRVEGPHAEAVGRLVEELVLLAQKGQHLDAATVTRAIDMVRADERPSAVLAEDILRGAKGRPIRPKTAGQKRYV